MRQQTRETFNVLFFIKRSRLLKNGEAPIRVRITINGRALEISAKRSVLPSRWDQNKERSRDKTPNAREVNHHLDMLRLRILQTHSHLENRGATVTIKDLREQLLYDSQPKKVHTIVEIFSDHNKQCRELIGIDYTKSTVDKFGTSLNHLKIYIEMAYGKVDMPLEELSPSFVRGFEHYLKTTARCQNNSALKHLKNLKKVVRIAIVNEWMPRDPFYGIKFKREEVHPEFLTEEELMCVMNKDFGIERLNIVRDLFIFNAFTGLSFIDAQKLTNEHIIADNSGALWIRKSRQKTGNMCNIPIIPPTKEILDRYSTHYECNDKEYLLPRISNQRMNAYLKEIAVICKINKKLSSHLARHTFSTSVTLANGVSIENLAKMLGHSDIRMTQHYARVLDKSIMHDMEVVSQRVSAKFK